MHVSCGPEKHEIHVSSSFSAGPTEAKIEVVMTGEFPEEDQGIHMKLFLFSFHYYYCNYSRTMSKQGPRKESKIWNEKALAGSNLKRLRSTF